jgi:hypothetical protein
MFRGAVARRDLIRRIRDFHDPAMAEHRQDLVVESPRAFVVRDRERDVIQHRYALPSWFAEDAPAEQSVVYVAWAAKWS